MERILNLVFTSENVRVLVLLVFGFSGLILLKTSLEKRIDGVESSLNKRIDGMEASIKELKYNDLAHLNNAIEALTYALEKNGSLKPEDKEFVDSRLAR